MGDHGLDALIVSGSEYSGFEGAVTYMSGFQIVHRYAYVVLPADGEPFIVFPAEARYVAEGCGRLTMNMVLTGTNASARPEFKIARSDEVLRGFVLPSLEVAGPGMHWVEVSRAVRAAAVEPSDETKRMLEAYVE